MTNGDAIYGSTVRKQTKEGNQRPLRCRRGSPTLPSKNDGWPGRTAPRSPGQPRPGASDAVGSADKVGLRIPAAELEAQALACAHLVRACRQALDDLRLESDSDSRAARAAEILGEIQSEWSTALAALRKLSRR